MYPRRLTRRQFMVALRRRRQASSRPCIGPSLSTSPEPRPSYGSSPSSIDTRWPIDRVVYVMLENRSYDNIFGRYPGPTARRRGSGSAPRCRFAAAPSGCPETFRTIPSPGTRRTTMAGWMGSRSVTSVRRGRIHSSIGPPYYFHWADNYALCDNTFASVPGPSYPNHLFFVAGQAGGAIDNPENIRTRRENGTVFKSWAATPTGTTCTSTRLPPTAPPTPSRPASSSTASGRP